MENFNTQPTTLNDWKKAHPGVRGTIYHDTSSKGHNMRGVSVHHNAYRAEVVYFGKRYRKRSTSYEDCVKFLVKLHREHEDEKDAVQQSFDF